MIKTHPSTYISEFCEHIPSILRHLASPSSPTLRDEVARLLGTIVRVFLTSSIAPHLRLSISGHIISFIETQTSRRKLSTNRLPQLINAALDKPNQENKPQWALTLAANLVVLSDASIFSHPRCLKFIIPVIAKTLTSKSRAIRDTISPLWKCIIWAFARLRDIGEHDQEDLDSTSNFENTCESAFLVCNQELRADAGAALVGVLLGHPAGFPTSFSPADVSRATQVVAALVGHKQEKERQMGLSLLMRLVSGIGSSPLETQTDSEWDYNNLLAGGFFDGSVLGASRSGLQNLIAGIPPTDIFTIRQLSEAEIEHHWDSLLQIWVVCIKWYTTTAVPVSFILILTAASTNWISII